MSLVQKCRALGWSVESPRANSWDIIVPANPPIAVTCSQMPDGHHYSCRIDSQPIFNDLVKSFSVSTTNCPVLTFRADREFIDGGDFFRWIKTRTSEADVKTEDDREFDGVAEELRGQSETERLSMASARKGQDALRRALISSGMSRCVISGVEIPELLIVSHIKGWKECRDDTGKERLDPENVLLLAANWDALFDKHFISFDPETGKMIKSKRIDEETLRKFGVPDDWRESVSIPVQTDRRKGYLRWHNMRMAEEDEKSVKKRNTEG